MEQKMKKTLFYLIFVLLITFSIYTEETEVLDISDTNFYFLDQFIKSDFKQEIEITKCYFTTNTIIEYIKIKETEDSVYILKYFNNTMTIKRIKKDIFNQVIRNISFILENTFISEYSNPPGDDMSTIVSINFRGNLNYSINMFNLFMLREEDYRNKLITEIETISN